VVIGWLSGLTALMILSYYSVVAGWGLAYIEKMDSGVFADSSARLVGEAFQAFLADPEALVYWQSLFIALTFIVSGLGVHRGVGAMCWFAIPVLLVVLVALIAHSMEYGDMQRTQEFLFSSNSFDFTPESALIAMGQAFYTLTVGVGVGLAYGSYAPEKLPIGRTVLAVAVLDTAFAIAAGLAIFPTVFAANLEPSMGPGLMFVSLPYAFGNMFQGEMLGLLFFVMMSVVTLGSAVALAEVPVSYMVQRMRMRRPVAALVVAVCVWMLALALSFNQWQDIYWYKDMTLFSLLDFVSADILLPLVCLLTAMFVGYGMKREVLRIEMYRENATFFFLWRACLRYIAPPVIVLIMLIALYEPV
jgi:NSS family neurotransmitter:Na+ symporter